VKAQPGRAPLPPEPRGRDYVDKLRQLQRRVLFATGKFYLTAAAWRLREHLLGLRARHEGLGHRGPSTADCGGALEPVQDAEPAAGGQDLEVVRPDDPYLNEWVDLWDATGTTSPTTR